MSLAWSRFEAHLQSKGYEFEMVMWADEAEKTAILANFSTDVLERAALRTTWKLRCEALPLAPSLSTPAVRKNRVQRAAPPSQTAPAPPAQHADAAVDISAPVPPATPAPAAQHAEAAVDVSAPVPPATPAAQHTDAPVNLFAPVPPATPAPPAQLADTAVTDVPSSSAQEVQQHDGVVTVGDVFATVQLVRNYVIASMCKAGRSCCKDYTKRHKKVGRESRMKCGKDDACAFEVVLLETPNLLQEVTRVQAHTCIPKTTQKDRSSYGTTRALLSTKGGALKECHTAASACRAIRKDDGLVLAPRLAQRAKETASRQSMESAAMEYGKLRALFDSIESSNPDVVTHLRCDTANDGCNTSYFNAAFMSLPYAKRIVRDRLHIPLLYFDGTFMKGAYSGTLLTCVTKDILNRVVPIAVGLVPGNESLDSWRYFSQLLRETLSDTADHCTFLSDRVKGLDSALEEFFPLAAHAKCLLHLLGNVATAGNRRAFQAVVWTLAQIVSAILKNTEGDVWADWQLQGHPRMDEYTQNAAESFNSRLLSARFMGIASMFREVRRISATWAFERRGELLAQHEAGTLDVFPHKYKTQFVASIVAGRGYVVIPGECAATRCRVTPPML